MSDDLTGRNISRRKVLQTSLVAGGALATPYFFMRSAKADPKQLNIYNWDGNLGDFYVEHWHKPFEEAFDVKLNVIKLAGSRAPLEKVQAQINAKRPESDFLPLHPDQYIYAQRNNLLMEVGPDMVPEMNNLYSSFVTPHGPRLVLWCYGLAYNTELVKPAPTSWRALWDEQYAGRVAINEALKDQTLQMVNLAWKGKAQPVDAETFSHLDKLKPNLVSLWTSGSQAEQLFRNGEIVMTPFWNGRVTKLRGEGLPLEFVAPKEGFMVRASLYGVAKHAKNPELMAQWLDFILKPEQQLKLVEIFGYGSPSKLVKYTPEQAKAVVVADPEVVKLAINEDFQTILDKSGDWNDMWTAWKSS